MPKGRKLKYSEEQIYNEYVNTYKKVKAEFGDYIETPLASKKNFFEQMKILKNDYKLRGVNAPSSVKLAKQLGNLTAYNYSSEQAKVFQYVEENFAGRKASLRSIRAKGLSDEAKQAFRNAYDVAKSQGLKGKAASEFIASYFGYFGSK